MLGMVRESPWLRRIPVSFQEANPLAETVTVYVPGGNAVTDQKPELSAVESRLSPVVSLTTRIDAPGTRASVWSVAIPLSVAVSCCALAIEKDRARTGMSSHGILRCQLDFESELDV